MDKLADLINEFRGKRIAVLGLGREGRSSLEFLLAEREKIQAASIQVWDQSQAALDAVAADFADATIQFYLGDELEKIMANSDICLKSPGISFAEYERLPEDEQRLARFPDLKICGQIDLFLKYAGGEIVGVTGTKGKSTTSSMLYRVLESQGLPSYLLGNIGIPAFTKLEEMDQHYAALELSCHQLEFCKASPQIAILTNLFPEHLDHYADYRAYASAKANIARYQGADDYFFFRVDDDEALTLLSDLSQNFQAFHGQFCLFSECAEALDPLRLQGYGIDLSQVKMEVLLAASEIRLREFLASGETRDEIWDFFDLKTKGRHMQMNALMVSIAAELLGLDRTQTRKTLESFEGLSHRFEYLGFYQGIDFYNDSIATIPQATALALENCPNPAALIIGGEDRGIDYQLFESIFEDRRLEYVFCLPDAGHRIMSERLTAGQFRRLYADELRYLFNREVKKEMLANHREIVPGDILVHRQDGPFLIAVETLDEAVDLCFEYVPKGRACILSPAAASYNQYVNFEARGAHFKELIEAHSKAVDKYLLLVNFQAGRSIGPAKLGSYIHALGQSGARVDWRQTNSSAEMKSVFAEEMFDHDLIIAAGGDGTMRNIASAAYELGYTGSLAYIPTGSTCDYGSSLGLSASIAEISNIAREGREITPDLGQLNGKHFVYIASCGAFTETAYTARRSMKKNLGQLAYVIEGLASIGNISPIHLQVELEDRVIEGDYLFVGILNTLQMGGILHFDPDTIKLDDGIFELLLIRSAENRLLLPSLITKLLANDYEHPLVELYDCQRCRLHFEKDVAFTLDGEFGSRGRDFDFQVIPKAFKLRVPKELNKS